MRRPPLPAARTFNRAPRFSVPNFGMRTKRAEYAIRTSFSFHESHPGDTTFFHLPFFLFLPFFFAKRKKEKKTREEKSLCRTLVRNKTSERRVIIEAFHLISIARGYDMEGEGGERCGAFICFFFFCCATSLKSEILHRGEIKK